MPPKFDQSGVKNVADVEQLIGNIRTVISAGDEKIGLGLCMLTKHNHFMFSEEIRDSNSSNQTIRYGIAIHEKETDAFFSSINNVIRIKRSIKALGGEFSNFYSLTDKVFSQILSQRNSSYVGNGNNSEGELALRRLCSTAVSTYASDMHVLLHPDSADVSFRVQGDLWPYASYSRRDMEELMRIMYNLDATSGATGITFDLDTSLDYQTHMQDINLENKINVRYHHSILGNKKVDIVCRLNPISNRTQGNKSHFDLVEAGYLDGQKTKLNEGTLAVNGLLVLCGVTGSGKTTTIENQLIFKYESKNRQIKLTSLEEPIETQLSFLYPVDINKTRPMEVSQPNGKPTLGERYIQAIADIGRKDVNGVLLGEIRIKSAAQAVVHLVDTGQHIFTTIHTPNALATYEKLLNMECPKDILLKPDFFACIVYQELVQLLCPHCSQTVEESRSKKVKDEHGALMVGDELYSIYQSELKTLGHDIRIRNPSGCSACEKSEKVVEQPNGSTVKIGKKGIDGRTVVAEVFKANDKILSIMSDGMNGAYSYYKGLFRLEGHYHCDGLKAKEHALSKVFQGKVCLSNFNNLTPIGPFLFSLHTISDDINLELQRMRISINNGHGFDMFQYLGDIDILLKWQLEYREGLKRNIRAEVA